MLIFGFATTSTDVGIYITNYFGEITSALIQTMFYVSGIVLTLLGIVVYTKKIINY